MYRWSHFNNNGDLKRYKVILKAIGEYAKCPHSTTSKSPAESMLQTREQRERKVIGETT